MKHFSMLRSFHTADLFTIANGCCGIVAVFHAMRYLATQDARSIYLTALLVPLAIVFDVLDGRVARWRHRASPMGRELDSLADLLSFGVAPAAIAYAVGLSTPLDQVVLVFFVLCGLSRLARYNITAETLAGGDEKVPYFEGMPIPTSVVPLALLLIAYHHERLAPVAVFGIPFHLTVLLFAASGSLMISKTLRVPKP
jgi:CDP-diacylglycerol--serine O-phosphatidyltransferase